MANSRISINVPKVHYLLSRLQQRPVGRISKFSDVMKLSPRERLGLRSVTHISNLVLNSDVSF